MYYFKQNIKKVNENDSKMLYLLFDTAKKSYNELIYHAEKKNSLEQFNINSEIVNNSKNFKKLGPAITRSVVGNYNINIGNYNKNIAKDASYTKPNFRHKDSEFFIAFFGRMVNIDYNKNIVELKLNKKSIIFNIPNNFNKNKYKISQVRLHKTKHNYYIVYHYNKNEHKIIGENKAGIDLGVDIIIACYTPNFKPLLISGKYLKFLNYKYNKKISECKSEFEKNKLFYERDIKVKAVFNYILKRLFDYLRYTGTAEIFVGDFSGIKDNNNIVARNFYMISYYILKRKMKDYAKKYGVRINFIKEDYTSKSSFLDYEKPEFSCNFVGNRDKRGLFITKDKKEIHADINGAAQILSKRFYVQDRLNILEKPYFIDLVSKRYKDKVELRKKILDLLKSEYKRESKIYDIYNKFYDNPKKFTLKKFISYDMVSKEKRYIYYKIDNNNNIISNL